MHLSRRQPKPTTPRCQFAERALVLGGVTGDAPPNSPGNRVCDERRSVARVSVDLWIEEWSDDNSYYCRQVINISPAGVCFRHGMPYVERSLVRLCFDSPNGPHPIVIVVRVVWVASDANRFLIGYELVDASNIVSKVT
jgi:hypothetical protein